MQPSRTLAIDEANRLTAARLMARAKPEWWDEAGALDQLRGGQGWLLLNEEGQPAGWLLAKAAPETHAVDIETIGGILAGAAQVGPGLEDLVAACADWARGQGAGSLRFVMGSRGTSIHNRPLTVPWQGLRDLQAPDRPELGWWVEQGFTPCGLLPNAYGPCWHGILLIKLLA